MRGGGRRRGRRLRGVAAAAAVRGRPGGRSRRRCRRPGRGRRGAQRGHASPGRAVSPDLMRHLKEESFTDCVVFVLLQVSEGQSQVWNETKFAIPLLPLGHL